MSLFDSKITQNVAEAALKIMQDSTKKEEVIETSEMLSEEISYSAKKAREGKDIGKKGKMFAKISKEAGERYGSEEKGEKVAGAVLAKLRKESFSDLINTYKEKGFKGLNESLIKEEPDNETFTKEIKDQQENSEGKKKKKIANAAVQGVEIQKEEAMNELYALQHIGTGTVIEKHSDESYLYNKLDSLSNRKEYRVVPISEETLEEKELTPEEKSKKEKIVMSMKPKLGEFRKRYGKDRGESVLYAVATKQAKETA